MSSSGGGCGSLDQATKTTIFQSQLPVDYLDTSITINVWETIEADLSESAPAQLWYILMEQTNNGATVETLELEMTMPHPVTGVMTPYTVTIAGMVSGTIYYVYRNRSLVAGDFNFLGANSHQSLGDIFLNSNVAVPFVAGSVGLVRVRQTTAVDITSAQIEVNIVWDRLVTV